MRRWMPVCGAVTAAALVALLLRGSPPPVAGPGPPAAEPPAPAGPEAAPPAPAVEPVPGCALRGRVVDEAGAPVQGAFVRIALRECWTGADGTFLVANLAPARLALEVTATGYADMRTEVRIGASGITEPPDPFALTGLSPGSHRVLVSAEGFVARAVDGVEAGTRDLEVVLDRTGSLSGTVTVSETGEPVPFARILLDKSNLEVAVGGRDGSFRLEGATAGEHELIVRAEGLLTARVNVTIEPGRDTGGLDVRLSRGEALVVLVVRAADGSPVGGAHVRAFGSRGGMKGTDGQGRCVLTGLAPGAYRILVDADDLAGTFLDDVPVPSGEPLRVALTAGGTLRVRLVDRSGVPVPGRLVDPMWPYGSSSGRPPPRTDEDGRVVFAHAPPGRWQVRFEVTTTVGYPDWRSARVTVEEGGEAVLELVADDVAPEDEAPREDDPEAPR